MSPAPTGLVRNVIFFSLLRWMVNISVRLVNPFLPILALGLDVDVAAIAVAVSVANATSAVSPLLAPVAERFGRKTGMLLGLSLTLLAALLLVLWPTYPAFFAFLLLVNLGNNILTPTTQAYLGDHIPFEKRGIAIAVNEMSWALSFVLGMPLLGLLIARAGWQSAFWLLAGLGAVALFFLLRIPSDRPAAQAGGSFFSSLGEVLRSPAARAGLLVGLFIGLGVEIVSLVFGVWMKDSFRLEAVALGAVASVIGFSELGGELVAAGLLDRLGKRRSFAASLGLNILVNLLLPLFSRSHLGALAWLVLYFLTFEYAVVASMTLMTEILPTARATLMSSYISMFSLGVAVGSLLSEALYRFGFQANALACAVVFAVALALLFTIKINPAPYPSRPTP